MDRLAPVPQEIDTAYHRLHWSVALTENAATRSLNALARILPRAMRYDSLITGLAGRVAGRRFVRGACAWLATCPAARRFWQTYAGCS